jgi:hypothetical protein
MVVPRRWVAAVDMG